MKWTVNLAIKYEQSDPGAWMGFSEANWAGDLDDHHLTTGNLFLLSGGAQETGNNCTFKTRYSVKLLKRVILLRGLLSDIGMEATPRVIWEGNQGAIATVKNPLDLLRTKHINIRYH